MQGMPPAGQSDAPAHDRRSAEDLLALARRGDGEAFRGLVEPYRRELQVHCYRILGSVQDAEDLLQETLLAAWRGIGGYEERASVRTWLYRIATKPLSQRPAGRCPPSARIRVLPAGGPLSRAVAPPSGTELAGAVPRCAARPDRRPHAWTEARYEVRESVSLAFLAALQQLPPRQRAVLVLRDVLGFRAVEWRTSSTRQRTR
ncbi:sigma factor [Nonomuraea dietziae]|uniref:sigma factor n=1 Tax=Nonomuraea dietziae TaxID=65515 RepID=UPI0031D0FB33